MSFSYQKDNINEVYTDHENRITIVNGIEYTWRKEMKGNSVTIMNGKIFIDGFELTNKGWKRTLRGLYYLFLHKLNR